MLAEPFEAFTFSPASASVYQLGAFGTARKELKALADALVRRPREKTGTANADEGIRRKCRKVINHVAETLLLGGQPSGAAFCICRASGLVHFSKRADSGVRRHITLLERGRYETGGPEFPLPP